MNKIQNETVKPLILRDTETGEKYTLEFSRDSVKWAENRGFKYADVSDYPMTGVYDLFFYAFRMHHPGIARSQTDKIIDDWGGIEGIPDGVLERLGQLYTAAFSTLRDENTPIRVTVEF